MIVDLDIPLRRLAVIILKVTVAAIPAGVVVAIGGWLLLGFFVTVFGAANFR